MVSAIVDVGKENGNPLLQLPEGFTVESLGGNLRKITHTEDAGDGPVAHFSILLNTASRWVAWVAAPEKGLQWLENNLGAAVYRVTPELVRDNRTQLENLGLTFEGANLLAPHVISGQSPWTAPADP